MPTASPLRVPRTVAAPRRLPSPRASAQYVTSPATDTNGMRPQLPVQARTESALAGAAVCRSAATRSIMEGIERRRQCEFEAAHHAADAVGGAGGSFKAVRAQDR